MTDLLELLHAHGVLAPVDLELARVLRRLAPETHEDVLLAAALASRAVQHDHVCLDLERTWAEPLRGEDQQPLEDVPLPPLETLLQRLRACDLVRPCADPADPCPLVLEGKRLYLERYALEEARLVESLRDRIHRRDDIDPASVRERLDELFGDDPASRDQKLAAAVAATRGLAIVTGGPGTGKTFTAVRILALLGARAHARGRPLRALLLAPTGKAAQRLQDSMRSGFALLGPEAQRDLGVLRAFTLHKALGYRPGPPPRVACDRHRPLPADVVVVDEASMVDLVMFVRLVEATPREAKLVLLGDRDQLASVEAGAILGDLCGPERDLAFSPEFAATLGDLIGEPVPSRADLPPIADCITALRHSHRFSRTSGIGALAAAVQAGDAERALDLVAAGGEGVSLRAVCGAQDLGEVLAARYAELLGNPEDLAPEDLLARMSALLVLCAHRNGPYGSNEVNRRIERALVAGGILAEDTALGAGRPLIVTRNDGRTGLFNGDLGVLARDPATGRIAAWFPPLSPEEPPRRFPPARLPWHEPAWALTVHKAQGSEADRVVLVLPDRPSPIATRELVYTAITRARRSVEIFGAPDVLAAAIGRGVERASGLTEKLWSTG